MSKKWIFLLKAIVIGVFQAAIIDYFKIFGVKPDLLLITVVIASLFFTPACAITFSLCLGILEDLFSANSFGVNTLLFPLWSFLITELCRRLSLDNLYLSIALIFTVAVLNSIIVRLLLVFCGTSTASLGIFLYITLFSSVYTAAVSPLVIKIMRCE